MEYRGCVEQSIFFPNKLLFSFLSQYTFGIPNKKWNPDVCWSQERIVICLFKICQF